MFTHWCPKRGDKKMRCKYCGSVSVKCGFQRKRQRYQCKVCRRKFQSDYRYQAYKETTNPMIQQLLCEGCGIRSVGRILKISKDTVLSRLLELSSKVKRPVFKELGCEFEVDELWSFIGNKRKATWITYAIERKSRKVVGFLVGPRSKARIRLLINHLLKLKPRQIYTDRLNIYRSLIPGTIHKIVRYGTNRIERKNLTLRMHLKRLNRRSLCFSRNKMHLKAHLQLYFFNSSLI